MILSLIIVVGLYICALVYCAIRGHKESFGDERKYIVAKGGIGAILGFLTFSATLFSTFTLMGMPDFFRVHGIGAWIFLGVTDVAMAFVVLWFGLYFRKILKGSEFTSVTDLLNRHYGGKIAGIVYMIGVFVFLLPYVSIQIRGIAIFLSSVVPGQIDVWVWAMAIVLIMLFYSAFGGLRAIMYSDAIQGVVLLVVTWIIAYVCVSSVGGLANMFAKIGSDNSDLLSVPGPKGLFTVQFLISSFLAIVLMPISQPQLTIRLAILRKERDLRVMAIAVGLFSLLVILPTVFIGMYGAIKYGGSSTAEFLSNVLVSEQNNIIASISIVGLIAAAMSTADSQLFALGSEFKSNIKIKNNSVLEIKFVIYLFAFLAFLLAINSTDQLVMLARISFAGTSLIAPMVLVAVVMKEHLGREIPIYSLIALVLFLLTTIGLLPNNFMGIRIDLVLLLGVSFLTFCSVYIRRLAY